MRSIDIRRKRALLALAVALASIVAAVVVVATPDRSHANQPVGPPALDRPRTPTDRIPDWARGAIERDGLAANQSRRVAESVFLTPSSDGAQICLLILGRDPGASSDSRIGGSCNLASDFFRTNSVMFTTIADGPPDALRSIQVVGVVHPRAKRVSVAIGDVVKDVSLSVDGAFSYRLENNGLTRQTKILITAFDQNGVVIDAQALNPGD